MYLIAVLLFLVALVEADVGLLSAVPQQLLCVVQPLQGVRIPACQAEVFGMEN